MIETDRLILHPPSAADFDESYAISSDVELARFVGAKPATREGAWSMLLRNIGHWSAFNYGIFAVRLKGGGEYVGEVGLAHFSRGLGPSFDPFPEAAWVIASSAQGKGYATEALRAAHDWMAATHRPERTVCLVQPVNLPSMRLAARLGYRNVGDIDYRGASTTMFERAFRQHRA